ncbi:hypothetical protein [Haematomicrobium sanguinis]|uniref:pyroglutamyl-peptidase I family protein n=1 Tax=Haematomicrobium sanguinis TaxID=479106 RepID=UPI0009498A68|nr:hypothetical protein [Haematomicrobium sanguinis]
MILLSGFEPFGADSTNPSRDAARLAAHLLRAEGLDAQAVELPVVFSEAGRMLAAEVSRLAPDVVIATGLAAGRQAMSIERVAVNLIDARIPDNAGAQPLDEPVVAGADNAYFSTLPVKAAVLAMREAGIPVEASMSAGTYVCNALFYQLQHALAGASVASGFVHVPPVAAMEVETMARGLALIARSALERRGHADERLSTGSEE